VGVEQRDALMLLAQASDFGGERRVIGIEVKAPPLGDFSRVRGSAGPIKQLAVERGRRDEFCRRLAGISEAPLGSRLTSMIDRESLVRTTVAPRGATKS
jgi:hypothetical protein